jgi:hypothetical protein
MRVGERLPSWATATIAGVLWGGVMLLVTPAYGVSWWSRVVIWMLAGAFFGVGLTLVQRRTCQRTGVPLDRAERERALRVLRRGEPADDPTLRQAAVNIANARLRSENSPVLFGIIFGVLGLLGLVSAFTNPISQRYWILGILFLIEGPWIVWRTRRDQREARQFLAADSPDR